MFGSFGRAVGPISIALRQPGLRRRRRRRRLRPAQARSSRCADCRNIGKRDMKLNDAMPAITVDPETYVVTADGEP